MAAVGVGASGMVVCRATHLAIANSCIPGGRFLVIICVSIALLGYLRLRKVALSVWLYDTQTGEGLPITALSGLLQHLRRVQ